MREEYDFPSEFLKGIWHSTNLKGYKKILESKYIKPNPDISESERSSDETAFVRTMGGVSIFDFRNINIDKYSEEYAPTVWGYFIPGRAIWDKTIWLELDELKMSENYLPPNDVMFKLNNLNTGQQIVPYLEGAHIGSIHISLIKRVMIFDEDIGELEEFLNDLL